MLRVAANAWPGYLPLVIARDQGWLNPATIRLVEVPSSTVTLQMLSAGLVEAAALTLDEFLTARMDLDDLTAILVFDESAGADALLGRPGIEQLGQLRGQRVGVERSAVGALVLEAALDKAGLSMSDIVPVYLTIDMHVQAWRSGRIDALVTFEPALGQIEAAGGRRLFDSRLMPGQIVDVLAVRHDTLRQQARTLRQLLASHFKALELLTAKAPGTLESLLAPGQRADALSKSLDGLRLMDLASNRRMLSGQRPPLQLIAQNLENVLLSAKLMEHMVLMTDLCSADFLPASA